MINRCEPDHWLLMWSKRRAGSSCQGYPPAALWELTYGNSQPSFAIQCSTKYGTYSLSIEYYSNIELFPTHNVSIEKVHNLKPLKMCSAAIWNTNLCILKFLHIFKVRICVRFAFNATIVHMSGVNQNLCTCVLCFWEMCATFQYLLAANSTLVQDSVSKMLLFSFFQEKTIFWGKLATATLPKYCLFQCLLGLVLMQKHEFATVYSSLFCPKSNWRTESPNCGRV